MDSSNERQKPHVVCVPFPLQGHVNPFMQLAKLLHNNGFHITFVNSEFNHKRLVRSQGPEFVKSVPGFRFETIPDGLPPKEVDESKDIFDLPYSTRENCYTPFKDLVRKINSSPDLPVVTCVISDAITSFAVKAANDLGIPVIQFSTGSACGFFGFIQFEDLVERGIVPFKDDDFITNDTLDKTIDWISGIKDIRLRDLPNFLRVPDQNDLLFEFVGSESQICLKSSAIIVNTFQELESEALDVIMAKNPNVYSIGPLNLLGRHFLEKEFESPQLSLWKNDSKCIQWLGQWAPGSVVYVNYGSIAVMSEKHFKEFAWGLANSKQPFLWIVRPDLVIGGNSVNLTQEFLEEVKDRGYITSWCPQGQVLSHPSIGVFLTHCGWNSTIESICEGVPMICWPFFSDQLTNCRFACQKWGIGMEMSHDVKREVIEALVKEIINGEKGKEIRAKSLGWKMKALEATDIGGSSYTKFIRLIKEVLHQNE